MVPKRLNIRKRLLVFGAAWLIACSVVLTVYLVSEAQRALLESAVTRSQIIAANLADQARGPLYTGNNEAVKEILREIKRQPDIIDARIEYKGFVYDVLGAVVNRSKKNHLDSSRPVKVNGIRVVESYAATPDRIQSKVGGDGTFTLDGGKQGEQAIAVVSLSVEPIYAQIDRFVARAVSFLLVILLIGILLGWAMSGRMISPLRQLAKQVSSISGEVSDAYHAPAPYDDEIDLIQGSLNKMKESLNQKTTELAQLHFSIQDKVRIHTADLEKRNSDLGEVLKLKNDLILQLNHEVKTPLIALSKHISNLLLALDERITSEEKDRLIRIGDLSERVKRMLSDVLEFAIKQTDKIHLKQRRVSIFELTKQVMFSLEAMQGETCVTCVLGKSLESKFAYADPDHGEQILLNLVHNAIKASPPGSAVTVESSETESHLEIKVKDQGFGISKQIQSKLFKDRIDPDLTEGSGVGLFICRFLVELNGGTIWFETDPAKGTTFSFTMPKSPAHVEKEL